MTTLDIFLSYNREDQALALPYAEPFMAENPVLEILFQNLYTAWAGTELTA